MAEMTNKKSKRRLGKLFRFAALGALVAWLVNKKRSRTTSPEGIWRDMDSTSDRESTES